MSEANEQFRQRIQGLEVGLEFVTKYLIRQAEGTTRQVAEEMTRQAEAAAVQAKAFA